MRLYFLTMASLVVSACQSNNNSPSSTEIPSKTATMPLGTLEITMDLPHDSQVSKAPLGDEFEVVLGDGEIIVGSNPIYNSAEEAKQYLTERAGEVYSVPKDFTSENHGPGFIASYYTTGVIGTEYGVISKLHIGDLKYRCDAQVKSLESQQLALNACRSARK